MNTAVIYTCCIGPNPPPHPLPTLPPGWRGVVYTDRYDYPSMFGWEPRDPVVTHATARRTARWHKLNSHCLGFETDFIVWADTSFLLKPGIVDLVRDVRAPLVVWPHSSNRNWAEEISACFKLRRGILSDLQRQSDAYVERGMENVQGLYETGVMIRRPCSELTKFEKIWWSHVERFSDRDQVSLPVAIEESGISWAVMRWTLFYKACREWFEFQGR